MIDTMRFSIQLNKNQADILFKKSIQIKNIDHENNKILFSFFKIKKSLGSWDRKINFFINDENKCFLEFSIPKFAFGHNIDLIKPEKIPELLDSLASSINKQIAPFPYPFSWECERIDFCYAWKTESEETAKKFIYIIQNLKYPKRKTFKYDTSCMYTGDEDSVKFYLKHPEFYCHDFKELIKENRKDLAYELLYKSQGIIRFEISIRKRRLKELFNIPNKSPCLLTSDNLSSNSCINILNKYLLNIMKLKNEDTCNREDASFKLSQIYKPAKASRIYQFMLAYYSPNEIDKKMINQLSRNVIWYNLKQLKKAKIGFFTDQSYSFKFEIPSISGVRFSEPATPSLVTRGERPKFLTLNIQ